MLWIILWILTTLKYYESQSLNEKLKLNGGDMKFFSKNLPGHEIFTLWFSGLQNIFSKICKTLRLPHPSPVLHNIHYFISKSYSLLEQARKKSDNSIQSISTIQSSTLEAESSLGLELFIELVRQFPVIWNSKLDCFKDHVKKTKRLEPN